MKKCIICKKIVQHVAFNLCQDCYYSPKIQDELFITPSYIPASQKFKYQELKVLKFVEEKK